MTPQKKTDEKKGMPIVPWIIGAIIFLGVLLLLLQKPDTYFIDPEGDVDVIEVKTREEFDISMKSGDAPESVWSVEFDEAILRLEGEEFFPVVEGESESQDVFRFFPHEEGETQVIFTSDVDGSRVQFDVEVE